MKELFGVLIMSLLSGRDSSTVRQTLFPVNISAHVPTNADSAIAVELYKAEKNLDRLAGK